MYDVNSGDHTNKARGPAGAFFLGALLSLFLMAWWGFGGYAKIAPAWLQPVFMQIPIYLCVALAVMHGVFFGATTTTRKGALYGFLSPWAIVNLVAIPQFASSPEEVLLILLVPALVFASHTLFERKFHKQK